MGFGKAVADGFRRYFVFTGRSSRSQFWYWALFNLVLIVAVDFIDAVESIASGTATEAIGLAYVIVFIVPAISIAVRRLHDVGRSGLWLLLGALVVVGWIPLIYWWCQPTKAEVLAPNGSLEVSPAGEPETLSASIAPLSRQAPVTEAELARLERLAQLHRSGALTDEEFASEKARVLGGAA